MTARAAGPLLPFQPGNPVGNIYYGACSWTDQTLIDASTFYPATAQTAADRLAYYASQFPIVEVDATYYAIASERNAQLWVDRTPADFVLNIKVFGLFTHHPIVVSGSRPWSRSCCPAQWPKRIASIFATCGRRWRSWSGRCRPRRWRRWPRPASSAACSFSSRTGSPPGALTSATVSSFVSAATAAGH
jgi:hypothetical protein